MGTNYYCGAEKLHIGKSSCGWCFSLHIIPSKGLNTLDHWKKFWRFKMIRDEYGKRISKKEMLKIITERSYKQPIDVSVMGLYKDKEHFYHSNSCIDGPNGLLRSKIDKYHCVGHGEGTWDYIIGDFS